MQVIVFYEVIVLFFFFHLERDFKYDPRKEAEEDGATDGQESNANDLEEVNGFQFAINFVIIYQLIENLISF